MSVRVSLFIAGVVFAGIARAANLVPNPDFDAGLDGWTQVGTGSVTIDDSIGAPNLPSAHLVADSTLGVGLESSCVEVDDSVHADFRMNAAATTGYLSATIETFSDTACTNALDPIGLEAFRGGWGEFALSDFALPDGAQSAKVLLIAASISLGELPDVHFDHIAFGPAGSIVPPGININQEGFTGAWYNPGTSGQGFEFVISPNALPEGVGTLFGAWYTYDTAAGGTDTQRWYSLESSFGGAATSAEVTIYQNTGGNFAAPPTTSAVAVGTGTLSFDSCTTGAFTYAFDDGRSGTVFLQPLLSNVECVDTGTPTNPASDFGLSGTWYDPATGGQGFIINVNPTDAQIFLGWYTYAADGESSGAAGQRWFSAQGPYSVGSRSMDLTVFASTQGTFDSGATTVATDPVGTATLTFTSCTSATFAYEFTADELSGQAGTIELTRLGPALASCEANQ